MIQVIILYWSGRIIDRQSGTVAPPYPKQWHLSNGMDSQPMTLHALVSSPVMPEFDRESGSRRTFHLIKMLRELGWAVTYIPENGNGSRYAHALQQIGVATYTNPQYYQHPENLIKTNQFDVAILTFWYMAEHFIPILKAYSPTTAI